MICTRNSIQCCNSQNHHRDKPLCMKANAMYLLFHLNTKENSKATMGRQILITSSDNEDERTSHQGSSMPSQASKYAGSSNFFYFLPDCILKLLF